MNLSKGAVKRPITTFMAVSVAVIFGLMGILNLKMDLLPNMNMPYAIVMTTYSSAGSEEIKNLVTEPVESAMGTVSGFKSIQSVSSNGSSMVMVEFETDVDIDVATMDMREKIDMIEDYLPDGADTPTIIKLDMNSMQMIMLSATSEKMDIVELKELIEDKISDRIERQDGVASVSVIGGREREIQVVLKPEKLRGYGISESTVTQILMAENKSTPTGSVKQGDKNLTLRVYGEFESIEDIKNIPLTTSSGENVFLRDIADVSEVLLDSTSLSYTDGKPSISLTVQKQSTANTVNMSNAVMKELDKIIEDYPDISFSVTVDPADYIKSALTSVAQSAILGCFLAVLVLYVFLRNIRSTTIVGLAMPISIITTFALMYFTDITLNMMSLGGLSLGIGMLVDNSIVVLESIYQKLEKGYRRVFAAVEGAREVAMSVTASTLTTVAVFVPIGLAGGVASQMFNELSLTIAYSLGASLVVSLTFVPVMCSLILRPEMIINEHKHNNFYTRFLDKIGRGIDKLSVVYKKVLFACLNHKKRTVAVALLFVILTGFTMPFIGMDFMPSSDEGAVAISVSLPKGSVLEETEKIAWKVVDRIKDNENIDQMTFTIGGGGMMSALTGASEDSADINITLVDKKDRTMSTNDVVSHMRKQVKDIAGAEIEVSASSTSMGSYSSSGLQIDIFGEDVQTLASLADDFVDELQGVEGIVDVKSSVEAATPRATMKINRLKAASYGIQSSSVASIVSTAVSGSTATTFKVDGDEIDVTVMQNEDSFQFLNDVENITIPTTMGTGIPLKEIVDVTIEEVPVSINRIDQENYVSVTANVENIDTGTAQERVNEALRDYIMPTNYRYEFGGTSEQMAESFADLGLALIVAILLVYIIMAAQFESMSDPFIVMFSLPIAITGGLLGLFITGQSMTITAIIGLIMLSGVVVNNAIVLVDYANLLQREQGKNYINAMKIAGPSRLRPILMSTLTTVLSQMPLWLSPAEGSEMMRGLAVVVIFGLTLSTLVTLLLVPSVYVAFHQIRNKRKDKKRRKRMAKGLPVYDDEDDNRQYILEKDLENGYTKEQIFVSEEK